MLLKLMEILFTQTMTRLGVAYWLPIDGLKPLKCDNKVSRIKRNVTPLQNVHGYKIKFRYMEHVTYQSPGEEAFQKAAAKISLATINITILSLELDAPEYKQRAKCPTNYLLTCCIIISSTICQWI